MDKRFMAILGVLVVAVGAFLVFGGNQSDSSSGGSDTKISQPTKHTFGEGKSGVVLIEYGDFQCPACGQYFPIVEQLREKYKDQITFQFRNFPLESIHQNARAAHRAAEAANKQGKFWEMYVKLYEEQKIWSSSSSARTSFESYAKDLGLNLDKFKVDYASSEVNSLINADQKEGEKVGVTSTPTFVLDGKKIEENPRGLDEFEKLITEAINKKTSSTKTTNNSTNQ